MLPNVPFIPMSINKNYIIGIQHLDTYCVAIVKRLDIDLT